MNISSQCHNKPVLIPPCTPPVPVIDTYDIQNYGLEKGGYVDEDGCGSSGVWNISPDISLVDVVL